MWAAPRAWQLPACLLRRLLLRSQVAEEAAGPSAAVQEHSWPSPAQRPHRARSSSLCGARRSQTAARKVASQQQRAASQPVSWLLNTPSTAPGISRAVRMCYGRTRAGRTRFFSPQSHSTIVGAGADLGPIPLCCCQDTAVKERSVATATAAGLAA